MQRVAILLAAMCSICVTATADTTWVQGPMNGTWTTDHSPYFVQGNVSVPAGATLTIEPGVLVRFFGSYSVSIQGELLAQGTEEAPIRFTIDTTLFANRWQGLRFSAGSGTLSHCTIENASYEVAGEQIASAVHLTASEVTLTDCVVQQSRFRPAIGSYNGSALTLERCIVRHNILTYYCCGAGVSVRGNSSADIIDCDIFDNECLDGGGLYVNDGGTANVIGTTFRNNHAHSFGGGVHVDGDGEVLLSKCTLMYNDANAGGGALQARGNNLRVERCDFVGNVAYHGAHVDCDGGPAVFNSCLFAPFNGEWGIGAALDVQANTQITYCDLFVFFTDDYYSGTLPAGLNDSSTVNANGTTCDAFFNIYLDPQLVNPTLNNFNLMAISPCIDAGDPALEHDSDSTVADIGRLFYDQAAPVEPSLAAQPESPHLSAAYPNPFNPSTTLSFALSDPARVSLCILDLLGREVAVLANEPLSAGEYSRQWNASGNSSGIYFAVFQAGTYREVRKLVLMK